MEGFVGGQCARETVRVAALDTLRDGEGLLLRVLPGDAKEEFPEAAGARVVVNPCLSGGALEVFLEPVLPPPVIRVVGGTPIGAAVAAVAEFLGYAVDRTAAGPPPAGTVAVIVAGLGESEEEPLRAALDAGVGYLGLVASRRRGGDVLAGMGLTREERARIHTPAGLDIGARTPAEIGLAVLAGVVRAVRVDGLAPTAVATPAAPPQEIDPVCGMTVLVGPDTPHLRIDGADHWFCGAGCRDSYAGSVTGPPGEGG
jgi:xanthine dehydrogenase accessory factor